MMSAAPKKKKQTPNYDHVLDDKVLRTNVYEPEADSFLFLDALDADIDVIGDRVMHQIGRAVLSSSSSGGKDNDTSRQRVVFRIVEVGPGSGIVITHMGMLLRTYLQDRAAAASSSSPAAPSSIDDTNVSVVVEFHGIDMNPMAVQAATETWRRNMVPSTTDINTEATTTTTPSPSSPVPIAILSVPTTTSSTTTVVSVLFQAHFVTGDLFQVEGRNPSSSTTEGEGGSSYYDIVLFNPPYVPTDDSELQDALDKKDLITAAWCGGPRGRVVVDRFFHEINQWWYPSITGNQHVLCYVVAIRQNEPAEMAHLFGSCVFSSWGRRVGASESSTSPSTLQLKEVESLGENETTMVVSGGSYTRAAPPLPPMSGEGTIPGGAASLYFGARAIAARYTGEHLSILKFDAVMKE